MSCRFRVSTPHWVSTLIEVFVAEMFVVHEAHEAARAVAALFDLAAIGIEDAIAEINVRARRFLDDEDLVAADTKVPVGEKLRLGRCELGEGGVAHGIEHDKVVAQALHLGKHEFHILSILLCCPGR